MNKRLIYSVQTCLLGLLTIFLIPGLAYSQECPFQTELIYPTDDRDAAYVYQNGNEKLVAVIVGQQDGVPAPPNQGLFSYGWVSSLIPISRIPRGSTIHGVKAHFFYEQSPITLVDFTPLYLSKPPQDRVISPVTLLTAITTTTPYLINIPIQSTPSGEVLGEVVDLPASALAEFSRSLNDDVVPWFGYGIRTTNAFPNERIVFEDETTGLPTSTLWYKDCEEYGDCEDPPPSEECEEFGSCEDPPPPPDEEECDDINECQGEGGGGEDPPAADNGSVAICVGLAFLERRRLCPCTKNTNA